MKRALLLSLGLLLGSSSTAFAAPTKEACISAFDQAQQARRAGHFQQSREQLLVCSQNACPSVVRADCAETLRQVDGLQPTIVLKAADAKGTDLTDVTVELNGQKLTSSLDGRALPVDPGKLALVFTRPPWKPVPVEVVIAEGEKGRIIQATLGPPLPPPDKPRAVVEGPPPPPPKRSAAGWAVPLGAGAIGIAAFVLAGVTRIGVGNDADEARTRCAPNCTAADRDHWSSELVRANIFLGVGIGATVLAAASWFFLAPKRSSRTTGSLRPTLLTW